FEDRLQRALRDLRLVRRVSGEKFSARDQRINDDRTIMVVGAGAEEGGESGSVLGGASPEIIDNLGLGALGGYLEVAPQAVFRGDVRKQFVDVLGADVAQHCLAVGRRLG